MEIINKRASLSRAKKAIESKKIKIGFIGGSITAFENYRSWTEPVISFFLNNYKDNKISVVNSAIGGTKSDFALLRADKDLIDEQCDIVFIEYAVNDNATDTEHRMKSREGLIRKLLQNNIDIVLVYTFSQEMYDDMIKDKIPLSIAEFEQLAEHYNIPSVWSGKYALEQNKSGALRWEEWLPDGTHPQEKGSMAYAAPIIDYLKETLNNTGEEMSIKEPLTQNSWENVQLLDFDKILWSSPWTLRCNRSNTEINPLKYLYTSAVEAELNFEFEGTGIFIIQMFGNLSANFIYSIDGQEFVQPEQVKEREPWMGKTDWYRSILLAENLEFKNHNIRIITKHSGAPVFGTRFEIQSIGILK